MKTEIYNFYVPENLIAQKPLKNRSDSRLLVYYKDKNKIVDSYFKNLTDFLSADDFLVFNNSKVIPARLKIFKKENAREGEILILKIIDEKTVEIITDKNKKYPAATEIVLPENKICVIEENKNETSKILKSKEPIFTVDYLDKNGAMPLPPYIRGGKEEAYDKMRYQTSYAMYYGSAAAPTAGLHFDEKIFQSLDYKKIKQAFVSLHVGLGTFQPIYSENIEDHKIHTEEYFIKEDEAVKINNAIGTGKRIIPVGTTSLRTLESAYDKSSCRICAGVNKTSLYITPGYNFKICNSIITNFHTPKSSLAVLIAGMVGVEKLLEIYQYAVEKEYRFFSYGDAMLVI